MHFSHVYCSVFRLLLCGLLCCCLPAAPVKKKAVPKATKKAAAPPAPELPKPPEGPVPEVNQGSTLGYRALFGLSDFYKNVAKADEARKANPKDMALLLRAAAERDQLFRFSESAELFTEALGLMPDNPRILRLRGHRYLSLRRFDEAENDLRASLTAVPESFEASLMLGITLYMQGKFAESADIMGKCLAQTGEHTPVQGMQSCKGMMSNPNAGSAMLDWRYRSLLRAGRQDEAAEALKQINAEWKPAGNAANLRALRVAQGSMTSEEALKLEPRAGLDYLTVLSGIAVQQLVAGKTEEACRMFKQAQMDNYWSGFGMILAEVELAKHSKDACAKFGLKVTD
jgi:tetratricopeptide (TPR) repeat protein